MFEARSEAGLAALARVARAHHTVHMVLGDQDNVESFWHYYSPDQSASFASCRELMFQLKRPALVAADSSLLRLARAEDMEALLPVHAEMAFRESGINPLEKDPHGFRQRYLRRIEKDRVWVAIEDGRLLFKTDVALHTSDTVYLEGVHVNPEMRGTGLGCGLLTQVTDTLLKEARSVCLLVNEENILAQRLYLKAGFEFQGYYKTIFVRPGALN
ncbi:GNAT family N-acetyltransferase [Patescibacteria group bacterium]|nr:MAG: GNAT family N-acetyltransferase [Patescibacteria group bacterium]